MPVIILDPKESLVVKAVENALSVIIERIGDDAELYFWIPDLVELGDERGRISLTELTQRALGVAPGPCACGSPRGGLPHYVFDECDRNPARA